MSGVTFDTAKLRDLLKQEKDRLVREHDDAINAWKSDMRGHMVAWVEENCRKITDIGSRFAQFGLNATANIEQMMDEYEKARRALPTYFGTLHRGKPQRPQAIQEITNLLAILDVVAQDTVSLNTLERLGFTRDSMRLVVRLLRPAGQ